MRGTDWVYTYLLSFYLDPKQATGVNNLMLPGLSMPDVLGNLQGWQKPVMRVEEVKQGDSTVKKEVFDHFELAQPGKMSPQEYEDFVGDLTNFLTYAAEPIASERVAIGIRVMVYLAVLLALTYLLKKEFWRDVH
jgi:ubiquinol-cytochrome c reductase cytochrome c1 subunit